MKTITEWAHSQARCLAFYTPLLGRHWLCAYFWNGKHNLLRISWQNESLWAKGSAIKGSFKYELFAVLDSTYDGYTGLIEGL